MKQKLTGIAAAMLLSACASVPPMTVERVQPTCFSDPAANTASVTFTRDVGGTMVGWRPLDIEIDDRICGRLQAGNSVTLHIPAGTHIIYILDTSLEVTFQAGTEIHYRLSIPPPDLHLRISRRDVS